MNYLDGDERGYHAITTDAKQKGTAANSVSFRFAPLGSRTAPQGAA